MTARGAADLGLILVAASTAFAFLQLRRGGLDVISRVGLFVNLAGMSVLWLRTDKAMEGPILLQFGTRHGLTVADLLVLFPAVLCLWLTGVLQPLRVSARLNRK
jgi:hypothetical protein